MQTGLFRRAVMINSVPPRIIALTALASAATLISAVIQEWPLWGVGIAALLPWIPIFALETAWTYRHYEWLSLSYVLVITQSGHVIEHIAQMVQLHVLGLRGAQARGIFGALDIEWVHFLWNSWVFAAVALLLWRFPRNGWLWVTMALAGWHEAEHVAIMTRYLSSGQAGTPGLLAQGGVIGGGLPLVRPDLHFAYNIIETTPLLLAFIFELRRTYDTWLKHALPSLSAPLLAEATARARTIRYSPGAVILREGADSDSFYIITRGAVAVTRRAGAGGTEEVRTLSAGQFFGEVGLLAGLPRTASVQAKTAVELLALERDAFLALVRQSRTTAETLAEVVRARLARTSQSDTFAGAPEEVG